MKTQIRKAVWETNSSSTHSLQIEKTDLDSAKERVYDRIREAYKDTANDYGYDIDDYSHNGTFTLSGFEIESGDENGNVYYIIQTQLAKLQYLAMLIENMAYDFTDYDRKAYLDCSYDNRPELIKKTKCFKKFMELAQAFIFNKYPEIHEVVYELRHDTYVEAEKDSLSSKWVHSKNIAPEDIEELFNTVMSEEYVVTYADEAYRPYDAPRIYIV